MIVINYKKSLAKYIRSLRRKIEKQGGKRNGRFILNDRDLSPPKPRPLGWTTDNLTNKKKRPIPLLDPFKTMTRDQRAIYSRMPYRKRVEQRTHALANRLKRMRNFKFPAFKARILEQDRKRIRREKLLRWLLGKRYSPRMAAYLNTIPQHHRGKYVFYKLKQIFPQLTVSSRQNRVDQRLLFDLLRRQSLYKRFRVILRTIRERRRARRLNQPYVGDNRFRRYFNVRSFRRALRKTRLYYNYLPLNLLQSRPALIYRIRNGLIQSLATRPLRKIIGDHPDSWFNNVLRKGSYKRGSFLNLLKQYRQYLGYLLFFTSRRGRVFKPDKFKFNIFERIKFYNQQKLINMALWGVTARSDLKYNFRTRFENFYKTAYRRRWRRARRFLKRKTRRISTYNFNYYKVRKHFRRVGRLNIRKVTLPIVDIRRTADNFFIHVQQNNKTLFVRTAGMAGKVADKLAFTGPKRRTAYAAEVTGREVSQKLLNRGLEDVLLRYRSKYSYFVKAAIKGLRSGYVRKKNTKEGRLKHFKGVFYRQKLRIPEVRVWVTLSHNGLRAKKARRM